MRIESYTENYPSLLTRTNIRYQLRPSVLRWSDRGFALVITLTLMILLALPAVGLLSLSTIALREVSQGEAMATARANARMALLLALGELQKQAGIDTRVTARADILDKDNPPILGVWQSWQGNDHEISGNFAGRPKSPGSNYRAQKKKRFVAWLASTNGGDPAAVPDATACAGKAMPGASNLSRCAGSQPMKCNNIKNTDI